jgi:pimeloyl-ACP methyl ester carboxylesterase
LKADYLCVRVTLPHFGSSTVGKDAASSSFSPWGYSFPDMADILAASIRKAVSRGKVTLVAHDWGSHYAFHIQNKYPQLIRRMVVLDVGPPSFTGSSWKAAPVFLALGFLYQYLLVTYFLLSFLPGLAALADRCTRAAAVTYKAGLHDHNTGGERITAKCAFPYFWFHWEYFLGLLGMRPGGPSSSPNPTASEQVPAGCPVLFLFGDRKQLCGRRLNFHTERWEKAVAGREGCEVVPLPCGHWLTSQCGGQVNAHMERWLSA